MGAMGTSSSSTTAIFASSGRNSADQRIHLALVKLLGEMDQLPEF
jgi:hypothetical protein